MENVTVHRVGSGGTFDKYLLPFAGARVAKALKRKHDYIFEWSLFASYGALASVLSRGTQRIPTLITLADQKLGAIPWHTRLFVRFVLGKADQVYAMDTREARTAISFAKRTKLVHSIGEGDAFANQVRFTYTTFFTKRLKENEQ